MSETSGSPLRRAAFYATGTNGPTQTVRMPINVEETDFILGPIQVGENQEIGIEIIAATLGCVRAFGISFAVWISLFNHEFAMPSQNGLFRWLSVSALY